MHGRKFNVKMHGRYVRGCVSASLDVLITKDVEVTLRQLTFSPTDFSISAVQIASGSHIGHNLQSSYGDGVGRVCSTYRSARHNN